MLDFVRAHGRTFSRCQMTALLASAADYATLVILVEYALMDYRWAVAFGASVGACLNFVTNHTWAFESNASIASALGRYLAVSAGSLAWNVLLVWLVTERAGYPYYISKAIVSVIVGVFWNYPFHRYWVFHSATAA